MSLDLIKTWIKNVQKNFNYSSNQKPIIQNSKSTSQIKNVQKSIQYAGEK
jgi:hypothetical protein